MDDKKCQCGSGSYCKKHLTYSKPNKQTSFVRQAKRMTTKTSLVNRKSSKE